MRSGESWPEERGPSDDEIIAALLLTAGQPVLAARKLGCVPEGLLKRIAESPRLRAERDAIRAELFEMAVLRLRAAIKNGDSWAISLALKTSRGSDTLGDAVESAGDSHTQTTGPTVSIQDVLAEVLKHDDYLEYCRARGLDCDTGVVCADSVAGAMEAGETSAGD